MAKKKKEKKKMEFEISRTIRTGKFGTLHFVDFFLKNLIFLRVLSKKI